MKYLGLFLLAFAFGSVFGLVAGLIIKAATKDDAGQKKDVVRKDVSDGSLSLGTKLILGAMGAKMLDDEIEKHERESRKKEWELFYWQDAIRDEMKQDDSGADDDIV